jgi:hypothetical protein
MVVGEGKGEGGGEYDLRENLLQIGQLGQSRNYKALAPPHTLFPGTVLGTICAGTFRC